MIRVDWLGHATHDDGRTGYLITGPYKGHYVLRLDGVTVNVPAKEVALQRTGAGEFEVYEGES